MYSGKGHNFEGKKIMIILYFQELMSVLLIHVKTEELVLIWPMGIAVNAWEYGRERLAVMRVSI